MIVLFPTITIALNAPLTSAWRGVGLGAVAFLGSFLAHLCALYMRYGMWWASVGESWAGILGIFIAFVGIIFLNIFSVAIRRWYWPIVVDYRCVRCGYLLVGLPEPRCPECGTPFQREGINIDADNTRGV